MKASWISSLLNRYFPQATIEESTSEKELTVTAPEDIYSLIESMIKSPKSFTKAISTLPQIQSNFREYLYRKYKNKTIAASTQIQSQFRGYTKRKLYKENSTKIKNWQKEIALLQEKIEQAKYSLTTSD